MEQNCHGMDFRISYGNARNRSRPKRRWRDKLVNTVGTMWESVALRREGWRMAGKAYAWSWAT